jgi:Ca2+-binding EF-hand superfamily protein
MVNGIQGFSNVNAQTMEEMREKMFTRLDADSDGQISLTEIETATKEASGTGDRFTRMLENLTAADADGDGVITREEFDQMAPPPPPSRPSSEELFNSLDTDGDGQISLTELQAKAEEMGATDSRFAELLEKLTEADSDGDEVITREEFDRIELARRPPEYDNLGGQLYAEDCSMADSGYSVGVLIDELG